MWDDTGHPEHRDTPTNPRMTPTLHRCLKGEAVGGSPTALKPPSTLVQNHPDDVAPVRSHDNFCIVTWQEHADDRQRVMSLAQFMWCSSEISNTCV